MFCVANRVCVFVCEFVIGFGCTRPPIQWWELCCGRRRCYGLLSPSKLDAMAGACSLRGRREIFFSLSPLLISHPSAPVFSPLVRLRSTNNRVAHAKGLLQAMREETETMKNDPSRAKPSEVRVRENLQNTLTRKFVDLAKDYQNRQVRRWRRQGREWRPGMFAVLLLVLPLSLSEISATVLVVAVVEDHRQLLEGFFGLLGCRGAGALSLLWAKKGEVGSDVSVEFPALPQYRALLRDRADETVSSRHPRQCQGATTGQPATAVCPPRLAFPREKKILERERWEIRTEGLQSRLGFVFWERVAAVERLLSSSVIWSRLFLSITPTLRRAPPSGPGLRTSTRRR